MLVIIILLVLAKKYMALLGELYIFLVPIIYFFDKTINIIIITNIIEVIILKNGALNHNYFAN